jgi:hypothetical protein
VQRRFLATVSGWIVSLPHDLRVLLEAKDDPNLDRPARETAAGAILYVLSPESLGGDNEVVEYADDAILVRAALDAVLRKGGEGAPPFRDRFPEYYDTLADDLDVCKQAMGDAYAWLAAKVEQLPKQQYKNKKVPQYIDDDESVTDLYEDSLAFQTDYPIDEDKLGMRLKRPETLLEPLRKKAAEEKKKIA